MSFDKIFSMVQRLNENDFGPSKAKVISDGNKLVANPIDRNSLKVKAVGYQDMIIQGRLTTEGFNGILNWLMRQPDIIDYYYKLKDLSKYFVVYEITKDNDFTEKQVFVFTIVDRTTVPTLNPKVNHVSLEELQAIQKGMGPKDLVVSPSQQLLKDPAKVDLKTTGLTFPIMAAAVPGNKNTNLVAFFRDTYVKIKQEPNVSNHPGLAKVKAEINKGELGKATQAFLYALNAGFNLKDWSGEETSTDLTAALATKLASIPTVATESIGYFLHPNGYSMIKESSAITGFDPNAFVAGFDAALKGIGGGPVNTKDIVVPADGFKYSASNTTPDLELKKFQEILKTNLPTFAGGALKSKPAVAAFLKTKADGLYGNRTKGLIEYLKIGLTDPKYPDNDGTTIKSDFVNRMLREFKVITEWRTYLGPDGFSIIVEGFDTGAADIGTGGGGGGKKKPSGSSNKKPSGSSSSTSKVKTTYSLASWPDHVFWVDGAMYWKYKKGGSAEGYVTYEPLILLLQTTYPSAGGHYILTVGDRYQRYLSVGGVWKYYDGSSNTYVPATGDLLTKLNKYYGRGGKGTSTQPTMTIAQIDAEHIAIAKMIKAQFPDDYTSASIFWPYIDSYSGDDESGAWQAFKVWAVNSKAKSRLVKAGAAINALGTSDEDYPRLKANSNVLYQIFEPSSATKASSDSFYYKFFHSKRLSDYTIRLLQANGTYWTTTVDTDFG